MQDPAAQTTQSPELVTIMPNGDNVPGGGIVTPVVADKFFATRGDNVDRAVEDVKKLQIKSEVDGAFLGRWLLTEISSWNRDKERLVILCENNILICKYDYVAMKLGFVQRILLKQVKEVQNGNFDYPQNSISVPRLYKGLRITWGSMDNQPWYQRWNPLNTDIPFATFTSHPVMSLPDLGNREIYDVQSFLSSLKQALEKVPGIKYIDNQPIVIESYAGFASYVHNQSRLGFSRERGGVRLSLIHI